MDMIIEIAKIYGLKFINTFSIAFMILIILISIDTATGWAAAAKRSKISSRGFKKAIGKIITYLTSVVSVRLVEIILDSLVIYETIFLSGILLAFLALTELLSIIENLIILEVPIPKAFVNLVINSAKIPGIKDEQVIADDLEEFGDIKKFYLKSMDDLEAKKYLNVIVDVWEKNYILLKEIVESKNSDSNELLYVKMASIIKTAVEETKDQLSREKISRRTMEKMDVIMGKSVAVLRDKVKEICYSNENNEVKLSMLNVAIILMIFSILTSTHKCFDESCDIG